MVHTELRISYEIFNRLTFWECEIYQFGRYREKTFSTVKELIAKATLLGHDNTQAPISIAVGASNSTTEGVLRQ